MRQKIPLLIAMTLLLVFIKEGAQAHYSKSSQSEYDIIYQIQVDVATENKVNWKSYQNLRDLGDLVNYSIEHEPVEVKGKTPIMLGFYLGKSTAKMILKEVKKRGYKNAKIINDDGFQLGHSTGKSLKYALQLGAFNSLALLKANKYPKMAREDKLYIQYKQGAYKVFCGLYAIDGYPSVAEAKKRALPWYQSKGFKPFIQKFR